MTMIRPAMTLAAAQKGVIKGDPMYEICAQSKVKGNIPRPVDTPN
jgi:hypothetical protein